MMLGAMDESDLPELAKVGQVVRMIEDLRERLAGGQRARPVEIAQGQTIGFLHYSVLAG